MNDVMSSMAQAIRSFRPNVRLPAPRLILVLTACGAGLGQMTGAVFEGIEFPEGERSFADEVIRFQIGNPAPTLYLNPTNALGAPNWSVDQVNGVVSLGQGGRLELRFTNNRLANSGDDREDLYVFEVGDTKEATFVAVRPDAGTLTKQLILAAFGSSKDTNADGFMEVGMVGGSTSSFDIDQAFPGFAAGQLIFDAVQLIDDPTDGLNTSSTVGADIDAVGAIFSVDSPLVMRIQRAVEICWNSQTNLWYQVEYESEIVPDEWIALGQPVAGNGITNCVCDPLSDPGQRIYRVRALAAP